MPFGRNDNVIHQKVRLSLEARLQTLCNLTTLQPCNLEILNYDRSDVSYGHKKGPPVGQVSKLEVLAFSCSIFHNHELSIFTH